MIPLLKSTGTAILLLVFAFSMSAEAKKHHSEGKINCDIQNKSCTQSLLGGTVTLDILPKPVKAMHELTFQVVFNDLQPKQTPLIDLGMPGMDMGKNQVNLKQASPGTYEGTGIIVRCPSGKTIWRATVILPEQGETKFVFDVVY